MKRILIAVCALAVLVACDPLPTGRADDSWTLKFDDESTGSTVNTSNWQFTSSAEADGGAGNPSNGQAEWNQAANCDTSTYSGFLLIHAHRADSVHNGHTYHWSSCFVDSKPAYSFQYGWIEESAAFPTVGQGFWPAFWTWDETGSVDNHGETDAYEMFTDTPTRFYLTEHAGGNSCAGFTWNAPSGFDPTAQHVYGADIESTGVTWYVDGTSVHSVSCHPSESTAIIDDMFVCDGSRCPAPASSTNDAYKVVDYVRAWQR